MASSRAYSKCSVCEVERLAKTLDKQGRCPFCEDKAVPTPPEPPPPKKVYKKRTTTVKVDKSKPAEPAAAPTEPAGKQDRIPEDVLGIAYEAPNYSTPTSPQQELAMRELCRRRLMPFIQRFRPKYSAGWVHEDICRRLERFMKQVELGQSPRLLLMCPPRMGKSEIGSRHFPPWVLGHHPDWEIIAASHTSSLTLSFSRYIRDVMRDPAYAAVYPQAVLDPSSQSIENWNLTKGGGYLAAGVGTGITGRGAHILLLDDLVKDMEAADSATIKDNTWEWYGSTAYTRLAPGGGVLGIMCMTGDTLVLMADGSQMRLDSLKRSDKIATYARGALAVTTVAAVRSSGRDTVFKMRMSSGKIVRANQRHPFLTVLPSGEVTWTRLKNLTTAHRIVTVKDSGVSGRELPALSTVARQKSYAEAIVHLTTGRNAGQTGIAQQATRTQRPDGISDSSTATASPQPTTKQCTQLKEGVAQYVENQQARETLQIIGKTSSPSITATTQEESERCFATTVTQESDILLMSQWHLPPHGISDFTLERVVSIEYDGEEEVFDVQVDETENFIANGLVSHNTWWSEDDWAGRIQQTMKGGEGDVFEIVRYPAINEEGDEYILPNDHIDQFTELEQVPEGSRLTRPKGTAIHPARYDTEAMLRIKRNLIATGQKRVWQSLYQQNPMPEDGLFFTKEMFRYTPSLPDPHWCRVFQAWDFAITEDKASDYTVGCTLYQDEYDNLFVADIRRFRSSDSIYIVDTMLDYAQEFNASLLGFEDGQIWKTMQAQFDKRCAERKFYPSYEILKPLTDKQVRAHPLRGRMQAGKIWFPDKAPWFTECFNEMTRFPAGKHDDQIDSLAWAVRLTLGMAPPKSKVVAKPVKSWKDDLSKFMAGQRGRTHMSS